jgi:hypothetical protein
MSRDGKVIVSITEIKRLLHLGYTRCVGDTGYHAAKGSIEQHYGLRKSEVKALFKDPRLQGLRVNSAAPVEIVIAEFTNNRICRSYSTYWIC